MTNIIALRPCCYCGRPATVDYTVHRDGFGVGPEVPLCNACAEDDSITLEMVWAKSSQTSRPMNDDEQAAFLATLAGLRPSHDP